MAVNINGTSGISGVDGTAGTPALQGTDTNTGISFGADTVNLITGGVTRATTDASGYFRLSGSGIQFNGDTAAANSLDDYEEGTWTPTISFTSGSATVANAVCQYTKIGQLVHISGRFTLTSVSSPSGDLTISSLPFTANDPAGDGNRAGIQIYFEGATARIGDDIVGVVIDGSTSLRVRRSGTTGSGADLAGSVNSSTVFLFGGAYAAA